MPGVHPARDHPLAVDWQELYLHPSLPQSFDGMQHRMVLHRAGDHVIPGAAPNQRRRGYRSPSPRR